MLHSASCCGMRFPLSVLFSLLHSPHPSELPQLSPFHHFSPSPLLSFLPFLSFDSLPPLSRGVPVSITQLVSSRDGKGVIGIEVCVCVCLRVCVCVRWCIHGRHNGHSLFHHLLMRCDSCLVESWTDDHTLPPLTHTSQ